MAAHESLSSDERRLIDEVFRAGEREVREVMTPRTEVAFLDASMTASRAAKQVADSNWSRFPVVGRDEDDVVGFVHVRDLFLPNHPAGRAATVGDLAREVKRLPGTAGVLTALSEMRRENQHLAIVVDEYGGTDGIVTLEDLIEEVIGEIYDEYDEEVAPDGKQPPGGPREVDGLLNLDDFTEVTGLELPDGPYETVAGYVLAELGRLPEVGDTIEVEGRTIDGARARRTADRPPAGRPAAGQPATTTRRRTERRRRAEPRQPRACATSQASRTIPARSVCFGVQPRSARMRSLEATSCAGSPARRSPTTTGTGCPVTSRTASTTSCTEKPVPLPRL